MADERIQSRDRGTAGRAEESIGRMAGDTRSQFEDLANQATGAMKEAYGKTMDVTAEGARAVKDAAVAGHDQVRTFMEDNPHTTTLIAFCIGLAIGYLAHQPSRRRWWG